MRGEEIVCYPMDTPPVPKLNDIGAGVRVRWLHWAKQVVATRGVPGLNPSPACSPRESAGRGNRHDNGQCPRLNQVALCLSRSLSLLLMGLLLTSCSGRPVGSPCQRSGDSFLARHNCQTFCLAFPISCPDGSSVTPNVCAGRQGCLHGQCPPGQVCRRVNVDRSFCVPDDICPSWRTQGVPDPVLESDDEVKRRLHL